MMRALGLSAFLVASPALGDVPERLEAAFLGWAETNGVSEAVLAIRFQGEPMGEVLLNRAADAPIELASLSKAITAVCAATLMDVGVWTLETTSAEVLGKGPQNITIAQLLTHQSGLGPDQTQALMPLWLDGSESAAGIATDLALGRAEQNGHVGAYQYNNENYAILGEMIAVQTGHSYVSYCAEKVLQPAGVTTAKPSAASGPFLPFGGWQMSAQDYARFHWHAFGPEGIIGSRFPHWPGAAMDGPVRYGMGMVHRPFKGRYNFWHFGALCFPGRLNIGSFVVMWQDEWSAVAGYDICPDAAQMFSLDQALSGAAFQ